MTEFSNFGKPHESQRGYFAAQLYEEMLKNKDIWCLTGDLGFGMFDKLREKFPDRFLNTGAAETGMMGIATGLALEGKIPFVYSITPFVLYRPFEMVRYINRENVPVKIIGGGRGKDYLHDGFSHWAEEDAGIMRLMTNISSWWPEKKEHIPPLVELMVSDKHPYYLNLTR